MERISFGPFNVGRQVFYQTTRSFAIVNIRPILPGHVLVCPMRNVARFSQLSPEEITDLFLAVGVVSRSVERYYGAQALNIAIQDGPLAGQSVPHVHCHIIPRVVNDLPNVDDIYSLLDKNDIGGALKKIREQQFPKGVDNEARTNRSEEEMEKEAKNLRIYIATNLDPNI